MTTERVADMTVEEIKAIIAEVVAQQLNQWLSSSVRERSRGSEEIYCCAYPKVPDSGGFS